jgi:hypothetical protein
MDGIVDRILDLVSLESSRLKSAAKNTAWNIQFVSNNEDEVKGRELVRYVGFQTTLLNKSGPPSPWAKVDREVASYGR